MTLASLAWALQGVEVDRVLHAFRGVHLGWMAVAMVLVVVVFVLRVVRFQLLLGDERPSLGRQVVVCGIGFLAINVVPLRLGELVRTFLLLEDGVEAGRSMGAVVIERFLDLLGLLAVLTWVAVVVDLPATIEVQGVDVIRAGQQAITVGLSVLLAGLAAVGLGGDPVVRMLQRLPVVGPTLAAFGAALVGALRGLSVASLTVAVGLAALVWGATIVLVWCLLCAVPGMPVGWDVAIAVAGVTIAGTVAIPTPGFFGPFEVFCKATLVLWAVEPSLAAAFAVIWHLLQFGFHVVTGGALLLHQGISLTRVVRASRETP